MQLAQRNVSRAFEMSLIPLMWLADVDEQGVRHLRQLRRCDVADFGRIAESLVVDQLRDTRMIAAHGAIRIFSQSQLTELHSQRVEEQQPADERLANASDQLDRLRPLDCSDRPGQRA